MRIIPDRTLTRIHGRSRNCAFTPLISRVLRGAYPSVEAGSHGSSCVAMLGARELDLRANANGRLVRSEGEEDLRREYSHNVPGLESPRNFCKYVDRLSVYTVKYFIKHRDEYMAGKLNKY